LKKGVKLRTHIKTPLSIVTTRGQASFFRYYLKPQDANSKEKLREINGAKSIAPLDCLLGLAGLPFKITPNAMLKIAFWAQNQLSFKRAAQAIQEVLHVEISSNTIRLVTNFVGEIVFKNDCSRAEKAYAMLNDAKIDFPKNRAGVLYIQTDGAALNTRLQDEVGSTWRENKLGEVFSSADIYYWSGKNGERKHRILKKEYVSYIGSVSEFKKHLLGCALRGGYGHFKDTVVISDGATWIRNMVEELFPDAQHILDYYHLCENVNTYAKHIFNMDEKRYKPWAKDVCDKLKKSEYNQVIKEIASFKNPVPTNCPVNLLGYITNNIKNIDYMEYEQKGYFIGSGAIESGNKTILQDRLKRAGMRWNTTTAQAVLSLKSKVESNLWFSDVELPFLSYCANISKCF